MSILPQNVGLNTATEYVDRPSDTFIIDWNSKQIKGVDSGLAAMRHAVEIILACERFKWQIYTSDFGSELEGLAGEDAAYIESELPRRIRDAFSIDKRILSAENFIFRDNGGGRMTVSFDVVTVFGTVSEEVTIE